MPTLLSTQPPTFETALSEVVNTAFARAKLWSYIVISVQSALFLAGVAAIFWNSLSLSYPWVALPVAGLTVYLSGKAGEYRGDAESLKRHLEEWSNFNQPISGRKLADFRQKAGAVLPPHLNTMLSAGNAFASTQPPGARRAAENLSESAWFSHHLARWCATALSWVFTVAAIGSLSLLLYASEGLQAAEARTYAAKCVSAVLVFLISGAVWKGWQGFKKFSSRAKEIEEAAAELAGQPTVDEQAVMRLLGEYQMARAAAPLIPTWVWKLKKDALNADHAKFRSL